ncbi:MAG: hypothetical protein KDC53_07170 [Saprospiraceae bacterium]|nr:hypothetical protein [Saprospiraceae bacterium]
MMLGDNPKYKKSADQTHQTPSHLMIEEISHAELVIARIFDFYRGTFLSLQQYDAIVIQYTDQDTCIQLVSRLRCHFDQAIYLKPVFIIKDHGTLPESLADITDGQLSRADDLTLVGSVALRIRDRCAEINLSLDYNYEELIVFSFLAFCYTRDKEQVRPRISQRGIYYPILSDLMYHNVNQRHFTAILDKMEREAFLDGTFDRATYVCSECLGDYLLYREVCPHCHSAHLKSEDVVHHFRCAHVGPLSDFRVNGGHGTLECPKCQHELKHIGVDYDKPATMHYCLDCNASFQNYAMKAECCGCGHDQEVEYLIKKELKIYSLTEKAINTLKSGRIQTKEQSKEIEDVLPWHLFVKTLDFEQSQNPSDMSHMVSLRFNDFPSLIKQVGEENKYKLLSEIVQIIKTTQQNFDFRGIKLPRIYFSLLQTRHNEAEIISQRIVFLINHLLNDNLRLKRVMLTAEVLPMNGDLVQTILTEIQSVP